MTFTLCDYNLDVLSHASIPNLLLAFAAQHPDLQPFPEEDSLEIPASLKTAFTTELASSETSINGIGGAWSGKFCELIKGAQERRRLGGITEAPRRPRHTLILASETLYSPASLPAFTDTLMSLLTPSSPPTQPWPASSSALQAVSLQEGRDSSTALVASKKV